MKQPKGKFLFLFVFIVLFLMAGCNNATTGGKEVPKKIHHTFLTYEENYVNDSFESVGDLYLLSEGKQAEKIASDVLEGNFYYVNSQDKVLFLDEARTLYEYEKGKEKSKLAENVWIFNGDYEEDIVTYLNNDYALYIINPDGQDDKIASSVNSYDFFGKEVIFLDDDGDLSKYHVETKQEVEIDSDVSSFTKLSEDEIAYLDDDYALFYKKAEEDPIRITGNEVLYYSIQKVDDKIVYFNNDDDSHELFISELKEGGSTTKIASDVYNYQYDNGYFYYLNDDDNLYKKKADEENSTKLASDVNAFSVTKDVVYYTNKENDLYKLKSDNESEKVKSSISVFETTLDGDIIYQTDDQDLYVNDKKVTSEIGYYYVFFGNLAYSYEDKLYLMENLDDAVVIEEDLSQYSSAYYQNRKVFSNELEFSDIAGVWMAEEDGEKAFAEIRDNGEIEFLEDSDVEQLEKNYAGYNYIEVITEDGHYVNFRILEDGSLEISEDGDTLHFTKSNLEEAEEYYVAVQLEQDKAEVEYLLESFILDYEYAVYWGDEYYFSDYVDANSPVYAELLQYITDSYAIDAYDELYDYDIISIEHTGNGIFKAETVETYYHYGPDIDFSGVEQTYNNTYMVEKIDGEFYIVDIKDNNTDSI